MRITESQRRIIVESAKEVFGADVVVRLFGSRADDAKSGGDIDLYIESPGIISDRREKELRFICKIEKKFGDFLPIDVVSRGPDTVTDLIHQEGAKGIRL